MPNTRARRKSLPLPMTEGEYITMSNAMKQLAMRNKQTEVIVMRIAKAGNVTEVLNYVAEMRKYQKQHRG